MHTLCVLIVCKSQPTGQAKSMFVNEVSRRGLRVAEEVVLSCKFIGRHYAKLQGGRRRCRLVDKLTSWELEQQAS